MEIDQEIQFTDGFSWERVGAASGLVLATAACGGGGSSGSDSSTASPMPTPTPALTRQQASRFLAQATNGPTRSEIEHVRKIGIEGWLDAQFALPRPQGHWDWLIAAEYHLDAPNIAITRGWDNTIWHQLIEAPDQLRQRVALALLDHFVVSAEGITDTWRQFAMAAYMDVLLDNAFGTFRQLLGAITTNMAMGSFLTFLANRKANGTGSVPDENYAREILQLFTIGLYQLNPDGTPKVGSDGRPIETFNQNDVSQLARIFTGLVEVNNEYLTPYRHRTPLVIWKDINETGASIFLGATVSGGGLGAINAALDHICSHPNVAPFVSRALIQRLVTSNPTPGYVARVAAIFTDDGNGIRGNLKALVSAILLDEEARGTADLRGPFGGKIRDPIQRFTSWARASEVRSTSGLWEVGDTSGAADGLAQSPGRSPSVFNFFRPGYAPPKTSIADAGLVAPELQITSEQTVLGYANFMHKAVSGGMTDLVADYSAYEALADDSNKLVQELNIVLACGQLGTASVQTICGAVDAIAMSESDAVARRVRTAMLLVLVAPDFIHLA